MTKHRGQQSTGRAPGRDSHTDRNGEHPAGLGIWGQWYQVSKLLRRTVRGQNLGVRPPNPQLRNWFHLPPKGLGERGE